MPFTLTLGSTNWNDGLKRFSSASGTPRTHHWSTALPRWMACLALSPSLSSALAPLTAAALLKPARPTLLFPGEPAAPRRTGTTPNACKHKAPAMSSRRVPPRRFA